MSSLWRERFTWHPVVVDELVVATEGSADAESEVPHGRVIFDENIQLLVVGLRVVVVAGPLLERSLILVPSLDRHSWLVNSTTSSVTVGAPE